MCKLNIHGKCVHKLFTHSALGPLVMWYKDQRFIVQTSISRFWCWLWFWQDLKFCSEKKVLDPKCTKMFCTWKLKISLSSIALLPCFYDDFVQHWDMIKGTCLSSECCYFLNKYNITLQDCVTLPSSKYFVLIARL